MASGRRLRGAALLGALALVMAGCGDAGVATERADAGTGTTGTAPPTEPPPTVPPGTSPATDPDDSTPPSSEAPPTTATPFDVEPLEWTQFEDNIETAILEVPVDYEDPDGPTFELFLARRLADDQENKIGSLLINRGGPGFGGAVLAANAELNFPEELIERFDIVGWDPRGTSFSEPPIDCIEDYDRYFAGPDITPDDETERQEIVDLAREFTEHCVENNGDILPYVTTNNSARDMDSIRRALGEDEISYLGFSYGSELGATWATLFPETVRVAVLDGASDPDADPLEGRLQQVRGFEATLTTYLAQCSADADCAFHNDGDAEGAFADLMASVDETPIPSEPGRPDVNLGVFRQAFVEAMYSDTDWEQLSEALAGAQDGDGAGLLALYDRYYERRDDETWGNELEAFESIRCMDQVARPTIEESDAEALIVNEAAPRASPATTGDYMCTFFPESVDPRVEITGADAGPIVVVGTTGDAATPLDSTRAMAAALEDGRLVVVTADQHTGYRVNDCINDIVHAYLIDLEVPPAESQC